MSLSKWLAFSWFINTNGVVPQRSAVLTRVIARVRNRQYLVVQYKVFYEQRSHGAEFIVYKRLRRVVFHIGGAFYYGPFFQIHIFVKINYCKY